MEPRLPPAPDLTNAILARTSGSPCARLRELACACVDGGLDASQQLLAEGHLAHCADCRALVAGLREARAVLPALGGAEPGPWFTAQVLRATVKAQPADFWTRLLHRPRIALETAFLGTAACFLGVALPQRSALPSVPALVQPVDATLHRTAAKVADTGRRLADCADRTGRSQARRAEALGVRLARRLRRWVRPGGPLQSDHPPEPANP